MAPTVYLISGANRGIGLALVKALAMREGAIVFAGARNPEGATELRELAAAQAPGKVHVVKLVSSDKPGNEAAIEEVKSKAGRLDVVIANAGISQYYGRGVDAPPESFREHFEVNVVGTLVLFQASLELLKASTRAPKFVIISSGAGSITEGAQMSLGMLPYGVSKAAENYLARKLHFEHEQDGLIVFPLNPGATETDLAKGAFAGDEKGMQGIGFKSADECATQLLSVIDRATRDEEGGQFVNFDGERRPW
ncbi:NAD(P)-binding protein [Punctularia strigosozonata HHB-11173 SS5]|uniref:NAD(P)-binding protein n=1 Tax=Punctularia strigosozonata (strain HHB-11173) TaxID=741275 RepID=UPI0004417511|nr:NAD(P)-binding protein [Punctularia strigosozonata HHB-11173 SS5]EIN06063.1 NAD(P)-binding protein [Punctularia strigosozonata HHB-11173 SS5]